MNGLPQTPGPRAHVLNTALVDPSWVLRRVESLRMDDAGSTLVRVSIDMLVDRERHPEGPGRGTVVPLAWAQKGPMKRLDVSVDEGHAHVLTTKQNAECVADGLIALGIGVVKEVAGYRARFVELATARAGLADLVFQRLLDDLEFIDSSSDDDQVVFVLALAQLIEKYILLVELHGVTHSRTTVKYGYDASSDRSLGSDVARHRLRWSIGAFGLACSTHVELEVPAPLELERSELRVFSDILDSSDYRLGVELARTDEPATIHHLVAVPDSVLAPVDWLSRVVVSESTVTRTALISATASAVLCTYLFVGTWEIWWIGGVGLNVEPSTSLLLAAAGAIGPLLGRGPRHWLVAKFVNPFRNTTTLAGGILFLTAVAVGTMPAEGLLAWTQALLLASSLTVLAYALTSRRNVGGRRSIATTLRERVHRNGK